MRHTPQELVLFQQISICFFLFCWEYYTTVEQSCRVAKFGKIGVE